MEDEEFGDDFNWEELEPQPIELPPIPATRMTIYQISEFIANALERDEKQMGITKDYLDKLYEEIGNDEEAATMVISYVQQRHNWDMELLAERHDIDDALFTRYLTFDENMWAKVLNTEAFSDMHHEVFKVTQTYIARAVDEVMRKDML